MADNQKPTLTSVGSTVIREDLSRTWDFKEVTFTFAGATAMVLPSGYPFKADIPAATADATTITQMLAYAVAVVPGQVCKALIVDVQKGIGMIVNGSALDKMTAFIDGPMSGAQVNQIKGRYQNAAGPGVRVRAEGPGNTQNS